MARHDTGRENPPVETARGPNVQCSIKDNPKCRANRPADKTPRKRHLDIMDENPSLPEGKQSPEDHDGPRKARCGCHELEDCAHQCDSDQES